MDYNMKIIKYYKTWTANDKCHANIDKKDFVSEVEAIDILTLVVWPVWTAL